MMKPFYKKISLIFYLALIISFVVLLIPPNYKMGVYTPNLLGWIWLLGLIPLTIITFFWLLILDIKKGKTMNLIYRTIIYILTIFIACLYWYYQAKKMGNI